MRQEDTLLISPDYKDLIYSGRIDFGCTKEPVFVYPCSSVSMNFTGNILKVRIKNHHLYWKNYIGYILDGKQGVLPLSEQGVEEVFEIPVEEDRACHEFLLFKRQDACHYFSLCGFELGADEKVCPSVQNQKRRIEVYGDSVSAGEVSEAVAWTGQPDPCHEGEYSNSWYSYAWITARKLGAQIHNIAQGGIALMKGTGWYMPPEYIGIEQIYDKIRHCPALGTVTSWDFSKYCPHVVIIAIGQNDSHPEDYMVAGLAGKKAVRWMAHYKKFVKRIRELYPEATILLTTTILNHDESWDKAIEKVCVELKDEKVLHFRYRKNGCGTPGHIRIGEAEEMAEELSAYILSLGEEIWLV